MRKSASRRVGSAKRCGQSPPGFALALALLAVVLIAALLAALFFAVNEETRTAAAISRRDASLSAAESAIEAGLDHLRGLPSDRPPLGGVETRSVAAGEHSSVVYITRLDSSLFWLVAVVGKEGDPRVSVRRIGVLATVARGSDDSIRIVRVARRGWSELF